MGQRHILHCDCNCFYASVEMQEHPELRGKSIAVCGDPEARHGIVLTCQAYGRENRDAYLGSQTALP
jgi:nucleotidyltransferase/DNA polymerase involved in DNA repair